LNTTELADYFIRHSPGFDRDLELSEIDNKHTEILKSAYQIIRSGQAFGRRNFRSWAGQSDLGVPAQINARTIQAQGLPRTLLRYAYRKLFKRRDDAFLLATLLDDMAAIKQLGGAELLAENPVDATPGVVDFYCIEGTSINLRWLRYLYLARRILGPGFLPRGGVWVDVGSYYGGLQGLVRKYHSTARLVLVDFHHQLCRSFIYLSQLFPDARHIAPAQLREYPSVQAIPEGGIMYVPVSDYALLKDETVDLVTNFFSLGEMRREFFRSYVTSPLFTQARKAYLVNRFVSAPYFDKTYDTDVALPDYLSTTRQIEYLDVFPIHHYLLVRRAVFGLEGFRNASSPYFEMITSPAGSPT
jgi:putative sugar O-methyltransferase